MLRGVCQGDKEQGPERTHLAVHTIPSRSCADLVHDVCFNFLPPLAFYVVVVVVVVVAAAAAAAAAGRRRRRDNT